jgi:cell division protein FtsW
VGILGKGPGKSTQRNFLPHPYSDFIYAIIIEEWGFLGGLVVLMLYLWFFARSVMIAKSCKTIFSSMAVLGLSTLITTQAFLHILVNVGILPVTGHTLPLISRGGTSLLATGAAFGIIQAVSRTIDKVKVKGEVEL